MPEQLGFDQRGRKRRNVNRKKCFDAARRTVAVGEFHFFGMERDIARTRDGPRDELLTGSGGPGNKGRKLSHAAVQGTPVPAHVAGEDGLPDRGAEARGGHGTADDVVEDVVERALYLVKAGEHVPGAQRDLEARSWQDEITVPVGQELLIEMPSPAGFPEIAVIPLVEQGMDRILVGRKLFRTA